MHVHRCFAVGGGCWMAEFIFSRKRSCASCTISTRPISERIDSKRVYGDNGASGLLGEGTSDGAVVIFHTTEHSSANPINKNIKSLQCVPYCIKKWLNDCSWSERVSALMRVALCVQEVIV
jgi:hypothetical protein